MIACNLGEHNSLYHTEALPPEYSEDSVRALEHLGPSLLTGGVNFGTYSENATRIELALFSDPDDNEPSQRFPLVRFGNVWNLYVEGIGEGQHYGYIAWGPNWPEHPDWYPGSIEGFTSDVDSQGNRFNPNKLLIDPFAKALHREHNWEEGSAASGPARTESTYAASAKSVVWKSSYEWSSNEAAWRQGREQNALGWNDLIIYEVHPKGFTASPASGVDHPGTYRGIAEKAAYFSELGITSVELLPIHEKPLNGGYWGYATINFFAPELSYASDRDPRRVIDEFKAMVDALHQQGIEVIVDVVYNHTGEGGLWRDKIALDDVDPDPDTTLVNFDEKEVASIVSFRGLDNAAYYALSPDKQTYWNNTGVGNQTRPNHAPLRRLILDSLRFYAEELHVDGFRFDLAPILGERDLDYNTWEVTQETVLQEIIDDPVLRKWNTRIIAEPWSAGGNYGSFKLGAFPVHEGSSGQVGWYEWNANFRDFWRSFMNNEAWQISSKEGAADLGFAVTGSYDFFNWNGRRPYHSVNFTNVHDGFTMYDLFSYNTKRNGCGPLNPVCCEAPNSPWCDRDSGENNNRSRDWGIDSEPLKRQLMRNLFVALMISHGTPMILGGDEWMRTQLGNNNAYSTGADNSHNWFDWGSWQASNERWRMFDFVRKLIAFRKQHRYALAPTAYGASAPFAWRSAQNTEANWNSRHVMIHYYDAQAGTPLCFLINLETSWVDFTLPQGEWQRVVDTQSYFDDAAYFEDGTRDQKTSYNAEQSAVPGPAYSVAPRSIVILRAP